MCQYLIELENIVCSIYCETNIKSLPGGWSPTFHHSKWVAQVIGVAAEAVLCRLEADGHAAPVDHSHHLLFQLHPQLWLFPIVFLIQPHMSGCLLFPCEHNMHTCLQSVTSKITNPLLNFNQSLDLKSMRTRKRHSTHSNNIWLW